jgi:hypothetical protein
LRTLFSFGRSLLGIEDCVRLGMLMHDFKAESGRRGQKSITSEHADAVRYKARIHFGWPSISLAQAFQFECTFRQKDVIGEWVPLAEPGISEVIDKTEKWIRGIVWQEIDENLILRHVTSKKQKDAEVDLKLAPMVLEELREYTGGEPVVTVDQVTKKVTFIATCCRPRARSSSATPTACHGPTPSSAGSGARSPTLPACPRIGKTWVPGTGRSRRQFRPGFRLSSSAMRRRTPTSPRRWPMTPARPNRQRGRWKPASSTGRNQSPNKA